MRFVIVRTMRTSYRDIFLLACCQALLLTNGAGLITMNGLVGYALADTKALATLGVTIVRAGLGGGDDAGVAADGAHRPAQGLHGRRAHQRRRMRARRARDQPRQLRPVLRRHGGDRHLQRDRTAVSLRGGRGRGAGRQGEGDLAGARRRRRRRIPRSGIGASRGRISSRRRSSAASSCSPATRCSRSSCSRSSTFRRRRWRSARAQGRPLSVIVRQPVFIVAVLAGAVGYGLMNLLMTATPIAMDFCQPSVRSGGDRHRVARGRHVRARIFHRLADPPLRRAQRDPGGRRARRAVRRRSRSTASRSRISCVALGAPRHRLELHVHRRHDAADRVLRAGGKGARAGRERFHRVRDDGRVVARLGRDGVDRRMGGDESRGAAGAGGDRGGGDLVRVAPADAAPGAAG